MNSAEVAKAIANKEKVVVIFDDNQCNPAGIIKKQSDRTASCTICITDPARGYDVGDYINVMPYSIRPYSWVKTLPRE